MALEARPMISGYQSYWLLETVMAAPTDLWDLDGVLGEFSSCGGSGQSASEGQRLWLGRATIGEYLVDVSWRKSEATTDDQE